MSNKNKHLLVCGAEPSSDRIASMTLSALSNAGANLQSFGVGGEASQASGMEVLEPLTGLAAMGWIPATRRAWALQRAFRVLVRECRRRRPGQALLIGFTSFNQALGRELRSMGIRVLWCVAPQVWAWRPSRLDTLRHSVDRLAVLFPFEEPLWRRHGYDVHYVGHPAVELTTYADSTSFPPRLAVMMGSRVQEVSASISPFLQAARRWLDQHPDGQAHVIVSPALPSGWRRRCLAAVQSKGISYFLADRRDGAAVQLEAYSLALCVSGTACLEAALSGALPVIAYRCDPVSAFVVKKLLRTPHIGLPNILLESRVFPELVQGQMRADRLVAALEQLRESDRARRACQQLRKLLTVGDGLGFGERMARLVQEGL
ncbi:MAG TPA: hypothetical protein PKL73_02605 [Polyangiaceae bacterium]|jgi:lipid-A-disaccharide synthase|nr:MAG: Lipid-A-disaccharide synthase [Deltaproteobacteria bacterium ADurb.Bin207]HNS95813.1 hypothetical protein [Polyangiaceae bacterium]HNZ24642.1 hypothetical protein [Polyangiaceae bacterium]HOD23226.1 hypothetical protein [Polyangiaceae bacterium]HOE51645.1 hypothetical protein [Polyangiaceae bacterium]